MRRTRGAPGLRSIVVIALDEGLDYVLPAHVQTVPYAALSTELRFKRAGGNWAHLSFNKLWQFRMRLLMTLLLRGVSVLMNDLDAMWMKDPFKEIFDKLPNSVDIIAQRASFPWELGSRSKLPGKWGRLVDWSEWVLVDFLALPSRFQSLDLILLHYRIHLSTF